MGIVTGTTAVNPCNKLQEALGKYMLNPAAQKVPTGAYEALTSTQNKGGFEVLPTEGKSRLTSSSERKLQLRFVPKICTTDGIAEMSECSTDTVVNPLYATADVRVTLRHTWGFSINEQTQRDLCEGDAQVYADYFMAKYATEGKGGLNKKLISPLAAAMGNYPVSGDDSITTPKILPVVTSVGVINPAGLAVIDYDYLQMEQNAPPVALGAGRLDLAALSQKYAGLTTGGINNAAANLNYFRDTAVNAFFNDNNDHILTWAPGSIQLVEWFDFVGQFDKATEIIVNGKREIEKATTTIVTPDGVKWDVKVTYVCGVYQWVFQKWFDVIPLPSTAFTEACQDYNYSLHYLLGCGDLDCTDVALITGTSGGTGI